MGPGEVGGAEAGSHSLLQGISSEPSPQSSAPLHQSMLDTQRPLLHWRKVFLQRRESAEGSGGAGHQSAAAPGEALPPMGPRSSVPLTTCSALLWVWPRVSGASALHDLPRLLSHGVGHGGFAPLTPTLGPAGGRGWGAWRPGGREEGGALRLRGRLTAVGWLLVRLVLAVGDTITSQAEVDAFAVGTVELILCPAGGVHGWRGRGESLMSLGPGASNASTPLPPGTQVILSFSLVKLFGGPGCWSLGGDGPQRVPRVPHQCPPSLTAAGEVLLEDAAPSARAVDMALVSEQTQVLAAPIVDATRGELAWNRDGRQWARSVPGCAHTGCPHPLTQLHGAS